MNENEKILVQLARIEDDLKPLKPLASAVMDMKRIFDHMGCAIWVGAAALIFIGIGIYKLSGESQ